MLPAVWVPPKPTVVVLVALLETTVTVPPWMAMVGGVAVVLPIWMVVALALPTFRVVLASRVKVPLLVVKLELVLPVKATAPPPAVRPALAVSRPLVVTVLLKVLAPPNDWVVAVTRPTLVPSALCQTKLLPEITAPLALLVWESRLPMV